MNQLPIPEGSVAAVRRGKHQMSTILTATTAVFGLFLVVFVAITGWSVNQNAKDREWDLIVNALDQSVGRVLSEQKSVAWWDEAVKNMAEDPTSEWVKTEFGVYLNETYGHSEIYVLDPQYKPVFAYNSDGVADPATYNARENKIAPVLAEFQGEANSKLKHRPDLFAEEDLVAIKPVIDRAKWKAHLLDVDGKPAIIAAITIVPNQDPTLLKGNPFVLVSIVPVDETMVSGLGKMLLLPDLTVGKGPASNARMASEPFFGDDGSNLGYIEWTPTKPGQVLLAFILPLVVVGVIAAGYMARFMFARLRTADKELEDREARALYEAKHDDLSGLPNRALFEESLHEFLQKDGAGRRALVGYIDVDRFKDINDTLGHRAGDHLIKAASARMRERFPGTDLLARFGGDEFAILRAPSTGDAATELSDGVAAIFAEPFMVEGQSILVTASAGFASAPDDATTAEGLMQNADIALYEAKKSGRNRSVVFSPPMAQKVRDRRNIEIDLREALARDQLRLVYQPVVSASTGFVTGVEALLRWRHPVAGEISPAVFIPVAEETGLIPSIGSWVLEHAIAQAVEMPEIEVAVNISPVQLRRTDVTRDLIDHVERSGVAPSRIVLEITEGVLLDPDVRTVAALHSLQEFGVKLALDDFGTGYSSLSYLSRYRFDKLKIDRSFVHSIKSTETAPTIVRTIVALGRDLGMDVVAEGIEEQGEAAMMRLFGVTHFQGYLFSRPVELDALSKVIDHFNRVRTPNEAPAVQFG